MSKKPFSFQRTALKLLCTLLGILLFVMLAVTFLCREALEQIHYADPTEMPRLTQEELDAYLATEAAVTEEAVEALAPEEVVFQTHETAIGGKHSALINILLIGQDRREGEVRARSDSMILCTVNKDTRRLTMTSIVRDLYVQIPGYRDNRINAAYAAGGMSLLKETLEKNLGIRVDGCLEVDFTRFAQLVDLLGGVQLELRQDEADVINRSIPGNLTSGNQWLTGSQALVYARIRSLDADGDFSRTNRQRKVLTALLKSYRDTGLSTLFSLVREALPMITTDMQDGTIMSYAMELFPILPELDIVSQRLPAEGTYSHKMIRDMAVVVADMDAARELLEYSLLNKNQ